MVNTLPPTATCRGELPTVIARLTSAQQLYNQNHIEKHNIQESMNPLCSVSLKEVEDTML